MQFSKKLVQPRFWALNGPSHIESHGPGLLRALECGATVVVSCQEGLHRSRQFTEQVLALQQRMAPPTAVSPAETPGEVPLLANVLEHS